MMAGYFRQQASWLPAAFLSDIGPNPLRARVAEKNLVLWETPTGQIAALPDACPHRGASLSLGRTKPAGIQCPYHGLVFSPDGRCVAQGDLLSRNSTPYHLHRAWGLAFVSEEDQPFIAPLKYSRNAHTLYSFVDEVEASPFTVLDNLFDLAHFGWVHGSSFGTKRSIQARYRDTEFGFVSTYDVRIRASGEFEDLLGVSDTVGRVRLSYIAPLTQLFEIRYQTGLQYATVQSICPYGDNRSRFFQIGLSEQRWAPGDARRLGMADELVWKEDKAVLESISTPLVDELVASDLQCPPIEEHTLRIVMAARRRRRSRESECSPG